MFSAKPLTTEPPSAKSKTPESEKHTESRHVQKKQVTKGQGAARSALPQDQEAKVAMKPKQFPLSSSALKVKQAMCAKVDVEAVVIRTDGSLHQIKYNGSSKQANEILNGRPTIIGELESIQTIIVRSLNQSSCGKRNETVLPVPFCNKQFNGNYLLYRVDAKGNPINLSVKMYEKYVADNKKLTEQARKNFNPVEAQEIKATSSSFNSNSGLTLVYLRSEVDKKVRVKFEQKNGRKPKDAEIEQEVNVALQKMVDDLVNVSTPTNDRDDNPADDETGDDDAALLRGIREIYKNENGIDLNNRDLVNTLNKTQAILRTVASTSEENAEFADERDWRLQLSDALNYVRERGRVDRLTLADKISKTFHELNGIDPTVDQLVDAFRRIKNELPLEAQDDLEEELALEQDRQLDANDNGSTCYLAKKLSRDLNDADPSDLVDYAFRVVKEDLLYRAKSSFVISKGRSPTQTELQRTVEKLTLKLANQALRLETTTAGGGRGLLNDVDEEEDADYDPDNSVDDKLARQDALETQQFDDDYWNLRMLTTPRRKSRGGNAETYDMYFCKFSKKREARNLEKVIAAFKLRNKREPNAVEVAKIQQFISTQNATNLVQFQLSVVSDDDDADDFTRDERQKEKTLSLTSRAGGASSRRTGGASKMGQTAPSKVLVTPIKEKKTAARYNVYFDSPSKSDEDRNEQQAIKWFQRFNNRKPTELEFAGIRRFIKADKSELTEREYEVPIFDVNDRKNTELSKEDHFLRKMNQNSVVKKCNKSTRYTLDFDKGERENSDETAARKWFQRFNNRKPTASEVEKIRQFIKADNDDTVDICR